MDNQITITVPSRKAQHAMPRVPWWKRLAAYFGLTEPVESAPVAEISIPTDGMRSLTIHPDARPRPRIDSAQDLLDAIFSDNDDLDGSEDTLAGDAA